MLEETYFRCSIDKAWADTRAFFTERDPSQIVTAERNPKHKMALVFRSYLGQSSHWANKGVADRKIDYQVWCGPAMAAFNDWVKGSPIDALPERRAAVVALNLLYGSALLHRIRLLEMQGVRDPEWNALIKPRNETEIRRHVALWSQA